MLQYSSKIRALEARQHICEPNERLEMIDPLQYRSSDFCTELNTRLFDMRQLILSLKSEAENAASLATLRDLGRRCAVRSSAQGAPLLRTALDELVSYIDTEQAKGSKTDTVYPQRLNLPGRIEQISMDPGASPQLIRRPLEPNDLIRALDNLTHRHLAPIPGADRRA